APTHHVTTLTGGLDVVPDFSLAEYDAQVGRAPDVIVVPAIPTIQNAENAPLLTWIRQSANPHTIVLSWCVGAETLALTGLLDGKSATTHWADIDRLERTYPKVHWQRGVRYVDNGSIVTSAGLTSGIDATLHVLERLKGRSVAQAVSDHFHYPSFHYADSPQAEQYTIGVSDSIYVLNGSYNWVKASYGALLYNGVGEIELASIFDTYSGSFVAQTLAVARTRQVITTEHGLHLVPRWSMADLPGVSRLLVPGANAVHQAEDSTAAWNTYSQAPIVYIHAGSLTRFAFDAPLEDLASQGNVPTAIFAAKRLEYRAPLQLNGSGWPLILILLPLLFGLLGLAQAWGTDRWLIARRKQRQKSEKSLLRTALAPTL
ncbi:MAG TPA: DJ-1/PfpI family protein, partial [Ktedonobacteraceae bacterium]|nr:DJ-1/PfpI family protein [Ktedonobacteraceae bacterium]